MKTGRASQDKGHIAGSYIELPNSDLIVGFYTLSIFYTLPFSCIVFRCDACSHPDCIQSQHLVGMVNRLAPYTFIKFLLKNLHVLIIVIIEVSSWMITGERQAARIRGLYLKAILRQDIAFFDKETTTGEVIGRMSGDTILIQDAMGEKVRHSSTTITSNYTCSNDTNNVL